MKTRQIILVSIIIYVCLLLCYGYEFGKSDLIQIDPIVKAKSDSTLYQNDLFIQETLNQKLSERSIFILLLVPFHNNLEYASFIYHFLFSILLLSGLLKLFSIYIKNPIYIFIGVFLLFFPFIQFNLGGNELYYQFFNPSSAAKAIGVWVFYFFLKEKFFAAVIISIFCTLMHPIVGSQIFLLLLATIILQYKKCISTPIILKQVLFAIPIYLLTAGLFVFVIYLNLHQENTNQIDIYTIFYRIRNPHHFVATSFSSESWKVLTPLFILSFILSITKQSSLLILQTLIIIGCIFYYIVGDLFKVEFIFATQWFKSTIWLEAISIMVLTSQFEMLMKKKFFKSIKMKYLLSCFIVIQTVCIFFYIPGTKNIQNTYQHLNYPFLKSQDDEIEISTQAKAKTEKNALFISPLSFSALKYYGERSSVVDFKAILHTNTFIETWWKRLETLYKIPNDLSVVGYEIPIYGDAVYEKYTMDDFLQFQKTYGITHAITKKEIELPFEKIGENQTFVIYEILSIQESK